MKLFLKRKLEESQAAAVTCRTNKLCYFVQKCKYFEKKKIQYKNSYWPNATRLCSSSGALYKTSIGMLQYDLAQ